jgi:cytochrome c553
MKKLPLAFAVPFLALLAAPLAQAADIDAGRAKVASVCATCHGANGVSVGDPIPNLAGQRASYLEAQLKTLKDRTRKNPIMNAIASQLAPEEIANVAAYFASLPGAASGAKSELPPNIVRTSVPFPADYQASFTKYVTIDFPDRPEVRRFYANQAALEAARAGKPLPDGAVLFAEVYAPKLGDDKKPVVGADGHFVPEKLVAYTAMQREAGWGREIPEMLRNEDWNYAVFTPAKQHRPGVNQGLCFACHKPLAPASYTFTLKDLVAVAQGAPAR